MDLLFSKEWWQILLILIFTFGGLFSIVWLLIKNKVGLKYKDFSFNGNDLKNIPFKLRHTDYLTFTLFFKDINILLKDNFRLWCIENGISHKEGQEWVDYKQMRIDQLNTKIIQFFTENYIGSVLTIEDFDKDCDFRKGMTVYFNRIFEEIRIIAKEIEVEKNTLTINIDTFIKNKTDEIKDNPTPSFVMSVVFAAGKKMIDVYELENRILIRRQMQKVEEMLVNAYTEMTFKFLTLLNRKLKDGET